MESLENIEKFDQLLTKIKDFVIYKHSTQCPVSTAAKENVEKFLKNSEENNIKILPFYEVLVIEDRPVSNDIAEKTSVRHQSPQILVFKNGKCTVDFSHNKITSEKLSENLI